MTKRVCCFFITVTQILRTVLRRRRNVCRWWDQTHWTVSMIPFCVSSGPSEHLSHVFNFPEFSPTWFPKWYNAVRLRKSVSVRKCPHYYKDCSWRGEWQWWCVNARKENALPGGYSFKGGKKSILDHSTGPLTLGHLSLGAPFALLPLKSITSKGLASLSLWKEEQMERMKFHSSEVRTQAGPLKNCLHL